MADYTGCLTEDFWTLEETSDRKDYIREILHGADICYVKFTKVNGDERLMLCTLDTGMIPEEKLSVKFDASDRRNTNANTLAVFDIEKEDWRSFRIENVTDMGIVIDGLQSARIATKSLKENL